MGRIFVKHKPNTNQATYYVNVLGLWSLTPAPNSR